MIWNSGLWQIAMRISARLFACGFASPLPLGSGASRPTFGSWLPIGRDVRVSDAAFFQAQRNFVNAERADLR